ncbi:MAG: asparaginase [Ilumatobacter sp.]
MTTIPGTRFEAGSFAPVAVARRNGTDESLHHGAAVIVDGDGAIVRSVGDPELPVYPRSSLKPFQASAMLRAGLDVPHRLLALVIASHSGEPVHIDGVRQLLDRFDLHVDDLANTPTFPLDDAERVAAIRDGVAPSSLLQNCSGKHAGMLATCRLNGWPTAGYLERSHPLQQAIIVEIDRLVGREGGSVVDSGVDGCGAPTHVMPLVDVARALSRLFAERSETVEAMAAHPHLVGGTGRADTTWMAAVPGLVAKEGAAGMLVLGLPDGRAAALKIADGSDDARRPVFAEILRHLDLDVDGQLAGVRDSLTANVAGHGEPVGRIDALAW